MWNMRPVILVSWIVSFKDHFDDQFVDFLMDIIVFGCVIFFLVDFFIRGFG
jgi:hypothetical protein